MDNKEKIKDELDEIQRFFDKHKISALMRLPYTATISIYHSDADKLLILEHAKIELALQKKLIENEVELRFEDERQHFKDITKSYPPGYIA